MTTPPANGHLFRNLVLFGRALRGAGLAVDPARMLTLVRALEHVDVGRRQDFSMTARCCLVNRPQDLPIFDEVFRIFWRQIKDSTSTMDLRSLGEQRRYRPPELAPPSQDDGAEGDGEEGEPGDRVVVTPTYSAREVLRAKDFAAYDADEVAHARRMMAELAWDVGSRRTRRWSAGDGRMLDVRRTLRTGLRFGGELVELERRARRDKPRPLVLICDVSGSMEQYTRMLLHFMHAVFARRGRVEAFLFATRLTRVTRQLAHRGVDRAVSEVAQAVPDWAGGTRIGDAFKTFNYRWSRRVLGSGAVVLVISDGWDRGEPATLSAELARLQRSCHRLIWLNPLLGNVDYQPLTRGMQAALPFVDDFLPVHNLASLEQLARHLNRLSPRAPLRRQRPKTPEAAVAAAPDAPRGHLDANPTFRHPLWGR
jgi:hypothetical protein